MSTLTRCCFLSNKIFKNSKDELKFTIWQILFQAEGTPYSKRVLVGNWVEERSHYRKSRHRLSSVYQTDYTPQKFTSYSDFVLDKVINSQGTPLVSGLTMVNNFSTSYDLSYNHFPIWMGKPITRKFRPRLGTHDPKDEYLNDYGNITNYGLVKFKKETWRCDKADPRLTVTTHYQDNYPPPAMESYNLTKRDVSDVSCKKPEQNPLRCNLITPCEDPQKITRCVNVKSK